MKIFNLIIAIIFTAIIVTGCQSTEQKQISSQENLDKANSDLDKTKEDSSIKAQKDSANTFFAAKKDWEKQVNENDKKIAELKADASRDKNKGTTDYWNTLNNIEQRNNDLTSSIRNYNYADSDWVQTKKRINNSMSDLVSNIKHVK